MAITEAPIRKGVRGEIQKANRMLSDWADDTGEITFIDTAPTLLTPSGEIDGSLFGSDRLQNARSILVLAVIAAGSVVE